MGCWRLGLCVQGRGAKAVTPVRGWGAWGRGEEVEGGGSELAGHRSTCIWGLLGLRLLGTCKSNTKQVP